jgi:spore maturation protein CgeB
MDLRLFAHSWLSDWNHGNAHFLRGLARALARRGHRVRAYEEMPTPTGGWSLSQLWSEPAGPAAVAQMRRAYPELDLRLYGAAAAKASASGPAAGLPVVRDWQQELRGAEAVIVHEWNPPELFALLLAQRHRHGFRLLLHDTHHRALTQPGWLDRLPLRQLDGVIAFGESLRRVYEAHGQAPRTYALHEAADPDVFFPSPEATSEEVVWIGNWGDEERTHALDEYLFRPLRASGAAAAVFGVRYPAPAQSRLAELGIGYGGYLPNLEAPARYRRAPFTVHVPRGPYVRALPGIPTIRVFEALACGLPLLSAPWLDTEGLFQAGADYWLAHDGAEMAALMVQLLAQPEQRRKLGQHGAATIRAHHTCDHRARQLEEICRDPT